MNEWMNEWMDWLMDGWMNEWTNERMNEWMNIPCRPEGFVLGTIVVELCTVIPGDITATLGSDFCK